VPRSIITFPLFKVWRDYRDRSWPALLAFWGVPNLKVINRAVHVEKSAREAGERKPTKLHILRHSLPTHAAEEPCP
jgi:hypothetical protein